MKNIFNVRFIEIEWKISNASDWVTNAEINTIITEIVNKIRNDTDFLKRPV